MKNLNRQFLIVGLIGLFSLFSNGALSQCGPLTTPYLDNNGQDGIMFDVVALQSVNITQFAMDFTGTTTVEVYGIPGTHVGNEGNAAAWTLIGTAAGLNASAGTNVIIPVDINSFICAGDVFGFYITSTTGGCNYSDGAAVGNVAAADANIQILEGTGKDYAFGADFSPRVPNVTVYYDCATSCCLPPTMTMTPETCVGSCDGTATATVGAGGVPTFSYQWDAAAGSQITQTAVGLCAGTYSVDVTDGTGCVATNTITVTSGGTSADATITPVGPFCETDAAFNLSAADPGGTWTGTGITDGTAGSFDPNVAGSGTHTITYTIADPCGDIQTTDIVVGPVYNLIDNINACENTDVTYPDGTTATITASTSYTSNLTTVAACDSIIVTNVTMDPLYTITEDFDVCTGATYNYPDGTTSTNIIVDESHVSSLLTLSGCDSIITTNITINSAFTSTENISLCVGADHTYPDGTISTNILVDESHVSTFVSTLGCDSLVTTNITANPIDNVVESVNACENSSVTYPDGTIATITASTSHTSSLTTASGCDSIIVTNVTMDPAYNLVETVNTCENSSVTYPDGTTTTITASTSYTSNLTTIVGCDSVIITNVTMDPVYNLVDNINACENSNYTYPDGTTAVITANTNYTSNLTTAAGCDSVIVTNVTMDPLPLSGTNGTITFCPTTTPSDLYTELGSSADPGGAWSPVLASGSGVFNPATDVAGTYTYTVTNPCGTISSDVTVSITADPNAGTDGSMAFCAEDPSVDLFGLLGGTPNTGGAWSPALSSGTGVYNPAVDAGGAYTYSIITSCGTFTSIVDVTLNTSDDATFSYPTDSYCLDGADPVASINVTNGGVFTISNGGIINASTGAVDLAGSGVGTFDITYSTNGPCPDVFVLTVNILDVSDATITLAGPFCSYDAPVFLQAAQSGGAWSGTGVDPVTGEFNPALAASGLNDITYTIGGLCGDISTIQVEVIPAPIVSTIGDTSIMHGNSVNLITTGNASTYSWTPGATLVCDDCQNTIATPDETTTYTIAVEENGCSGSDQVTIFIEYEPIVFVPNIFSPNSDGQNDILFVRGQGILNFTFQVYDRWGEKVFQTTSVDQGWNGLFRGQEMSPAVFMYIVDVNFTNGSSQVIKGDVTLVR